MMKTLYLDLFSGISGDMFIGALVDLGVDPEKLEHELEKLNLHGYHLHFGRGHKGSIEGVKFDVHVSDHHHDDDDHDHDHDHPHEHSGPASHGGHDHGHAHSHSHTHPHSHSGPGADHSH